MMLAYQDDSVRLRLEQHPELGIVVHCDAFKWSKELYFHYLEVFEEFINYPAVHSKGVVYAAIDPDDTLLQKFASMFGFTETETVLKNENIELPVWAYSWEK